MEFVTTMWNMRELIRILDRWSYEYYIDCAPTVEDAVYDQKFDELLAMEKETGIILTESLTQKVGYPVLDSLTKVKHPTPLLSLEKTKDPFKVSEFAGNEPLLISLKLDGLTVKLEYENGRLVRGSTRGNAYVGEDITHNLRAVRGVPSVIPYQQRLVITGEAFIYNDDFAEIWETLTDSNGDRYSNSRNLAAGSVRHLSALQCKQRRISFLPFSVLEGLEETEELEDSKWHRLRYLHEVLGFGLVPQVFWQVGRTPELFQQLFDEMQESARLNNLPIDGAVVTYNSIRFSKSCGATGHHYKDGIAFKYEDEEYETVLREIQWQPTRGKLVDGEYINPLAPVAIFDPVDTGDCIMTRATLTNVSIIRRLELVPGCRILVSRSNQVIPYMVDNLDRGQGEAPMPETCPCCGAETRIKERGVEDSTEDTENGEKKETGTLILYCPNPDCFASHSASFEHFASNKAMNIVGVSKATLECFRLHGWLESFIDLYHLDQHREEIAALKGYGEKSFDNIWEAIQNSRNTTFERFVISVDIPMIGESASKILARLFDSDLDKFYQAVMDGFDFTTLDDFGKTLNGNIHTWFSKEENRELWNNLKDEVTIMSANNNPTIQDNPFQGKTVVVTGTLDGYTRASINYKLESLGAKAGKSVSSKTDYVLYGVEAGSKLTKARALGVKVISEAEFEGMIGA